jgi:hypothetical protein
MFPHFGFAELLTTCLVGLLSVGLPVAVLVFLYLIYGRLGNIEDLLKKDHDARN